MSEILLQLNSNSFKGTFAWRRYRRNPSSSGLRMSKAWPFPPSPRAVRPTRWMYSRGSSGGSNWTIQSTSGMSRPRAATSVHSSIPESALQNWKKVVVRFVCFCFPCNKKSTTALMFLQLDRNTITLSLIITHAVFMTHASCYSFCGLVKQLLDIKKRLPRVTSTRHGKIMGIQPSILMTSEACSRKSKIETFLTAAKILPRKNNMFKSTGPLWSGLLTS